MEYGATTGRPRQINWLDIDHVEKAATINGITHLIINKMDILKQLNVWCIRRSNKDELIWFNSEEDMKKYILDRPAFRDVEITFSYSPEDI